MGKLALYRHYRSHDLGDLVGQDHVAATLEQALKNERISHAYLFTGPRGVGKTSAARILARRVNELDDVSNQPDIIEIDAASNNGVDEIRELREKVHIAPNYTKYKVYIIDEVHMLSSAAFNALLKTLEEPPSHAIFVLATTEPHKLPQTIISRTQHFPFHPIANSFITKHLKMISKKEKISISDEALELLAELGEGSMRDSISLLDQVANAKDGQIEVEDVESLVGLANSRQIKQLLETVESGDAAAILSAYDQIIEAGIAPQLLLKQLLLHTRHEIRSRIKDGSSIVGLKELMHALSSLPATSTLTGFSLEAALLRVGQEDSTPNSKPTPRPEPEVEKPKKKEPVDKNRQQSSDRAQEDGEKTTKHSAMSKTKPVSKESASTAKNTDGPDDKSWIKTLSIIKQRHNTLYGLLRHAEAYLEGDTCQITAKFQFHQRRLSEAGSRQKIADALREATGQKVIVKISKTPDRKVAKASKEPVKEKDVDIVAQVTNILGGESV